MSNHLLQRQEVQGEAFVKGSSLNRYSARGAGGGNGFKIECSSGAGVGDGDGFAHFWASSHLGRGGQMLGHPDVVARSREPGRLPHGAQKSRGSAIDGRTTHLGSDGVSQRVRKTLEVILGCVKDVTLQRKTRFRGVRLVEFARAPATLVRMRNLMFSECG